MLFTILAANAEMLIPLFAIVFALSIPIIAIYLYYRHNSNIMDERRLMIEKGMAPPELKDQMRADYKQNNPLSKGIDMLAVALGIVTVYLVSTSWHTSTPISIICAILFMLGVANIIKSFILKNETGSYE